MYWKKNIVIVFLIDFGFMYYLHIKNNECFIFTKKKAAIEILY